jgi:5'-3' exonuclease
MKKVIALVDGDGLIHGAKWRNAADVKRKGPITLKEACANYDRSIKECLTMIKDKFFLKELPDVAIAVKGPNNYRDVLYEDYKKSKSRVVNRDTDAPWLGELKGYAETRPDTIVCDGYEADDLLRIWAHEILDRQLTEDVTYVICTGDKDLDCIWGHHYQFRRTGMGPKMYKVEPLYSENFFWEQTLTGDSIDNIPGLKGVAHLTAMKMFGATYKKELVEVKEVKTKKNGFAKITDEEEEIVKTKKVTVMVDEPTQDPEKRKQIVIKAYVERHGIKEGYLHFLMNCKLLYMWKIYGGHFKFDKEKFIEIAKS